MSLGRNLDVLQLHALCTVDDNTLLSIVYFHILDADILYRHLWQTVEVSGTADATADNVVDVDVAEGWGSFIHLLHIYYLLFLLVAIIQYLYGRLSAIVKVESNHISLDIKHRHILDVDILYNATSTTCTLEAQAHVGTEELTVGNHHILDATAHFTAYYETAVTFEYSTAINNDILARNTALSAVSILSTFDADTVIAHIKGRVYDERVLARLQVQTITILCEGRVAYQYILDEYVLAHQRMDVPGWRILEDDAIEPDILAADEAYHHRTEIILHFVPTFFCCNAEWHVHARTFRIRLEGSLRREPVVRALEGTAT